LSRIRGNNSDMDGGLDEKSLATGIVQCLNILGADKVYTLLNKCDFMEDGEEEEDDEEDSKSSLSLEETETPSSWGEPSTEME